MQRNPFAFQAWDTNSSSEFNSYFDGGTASFLDSSSAFEGKKYNNLDSLTDHSYEDADDSDEYDESHEANVPTNILARSFLPWRSNIHSSDNAFPAPLACIYYKVARSTSYSCIDCITVTMFCNVKVQFKMSAANYILSNPRNFPGGTISVGEYVVVDADRGEDIGIVTAVQCRRLPSSNSDQPQPRRVLRIASSEEIHHFEQKKVDEYHAVQVHWQLPEFDNLHSHYFTYSNLLYRYAQISSAPCMMFLSTSMT